MSGAISLRRKRDGLLVTFALSHHGPDHSRDATIALGRLFWRVKEKIVETYKTLGERTPDDDLISLTLVTLFEQGYTNPAELEDAVLTRLRPIREKENGPLQ